MENRPVINAVKFSLFEPLDSEPERGEPVKTGLFCMHGKSKKEKDEYGLRSGLERSNLN